MPEIMRRRFDLKTEVSLALLPAAAISIVLFLLEHYGRQHLLFASLASSAFLIYLEPQHPANSIYTLVIAQVGSALIGVGTLKIIGAGYTAALVSMVISITFMIVLNVMHPPAVSTSLTFAFEKGKTLPLFFIAVGMLIILIILQKISVWLLNRRSKQESIKEPIKEALKNN